MPVHFQPKQFHTVIPYLCAKDAAALLEFLLATFDGKLEDKVTGPDGSVGHAEVRIGDSIIMLGQSMEGFPPTTQGTYIYVPDVDATYRRALANGATSRSEPENKFYGDRSCAVIDQQGNTWMIGTHVEDVSPEEMARRAAALYGGKCE